MKKTRRGNRKKREEDYMESPLAKARQWQYEFNKRMNEANSMSQEEWEECLNKWESHFASQREMVIEVGPEGKRLIDEMIQKEFENTNFEEDLKKYTKNG